MRVSVGAGTYIVAVSGGVDSMVLLDLLNKRPGLKLIVAHYDHGIRDDSHLDRKLVQNVAKKHNLKFVHEKGELGPHASEATARSARYEFLIKLRRASNARAIITAHHQDDVLETAIMNLLRGSGRKGLTSLKSTDKLIRPLLGYSKKQLRDYAEEHSLAWREDKTNEDIKHMRNYIRHNVLTKFTDGQKAQLLILLDRLRELNSEMDGHITGLLHVQPALNELDRQWFVGLPHDVAKEILHSWLSRHKVRNINKKTVERLIVKIKTGKIGQILDVDNRYKIQIRKQSLALVPIER